MSLPRSICNSFHGNIREIPEIAVDNFENIDKKAYFLSHYHADHIGGLFTEKFVKYIEKSLIPIYTSEITAEVLLWASEHQKKVWLPRNCIKPLKLGKSFITIPSGRNGGELYMEVKLIPAGHCLGSVMYLFRVHQQTILFTGDFRVHPNDIPKYNQLHEGGEPISIDIMYLDTTFQDIHHDMFPKRSDIVDCAIDEIQRWLNVEELDGCARFVALKTSALIGYEFIFKEINKRLGLKIYVDNAKMMLYSKFKDISECLTNDSGNDKIHICHWCCGGKNHDRCLPTVKPGKYLTLRFSAKSWTNGNTDEIMMENLKEKNMIELCFATHCSRSELAAFVYYFAPKKIVGFPNEYNNLAINNDIGNSNEIFLLSPPKQFVAKTKDTIAKVPKEVVKQIFFD